MGYEVPNFKPGTITASADLTAKQYYIVKAHTVANQVAVCGAGGIALGILLNNPNINQAAELEMNGIAPVKFGNTVTPGQEIMSDTNGLAIPATTTNRAIGICLEGGAVNEIGTAKLYGAAVLI